MLDGPQIAMEGSRPWPAAMLQMQSTVRTQRMKGNEILFPVQPIHANRFTENFQAHNSHITFNRMDLTVVLCGNPRRAGGEVFSEIESKLCCVGKVVTFSIADFLLHRFCRSRSRPRCIELWLDVHRSEEIRTSRMKTSVIKDVLTTAAGELGVRFDLGCSYQYRPCQDCVFEISLVFPCNV